VRVKIEPAGKSLQDKPVLLIGFIALSLVTHGLLFLFYTNSQISPQTRLAHTSLGSQKLSVTLSSTDRKIKKRTISTDKKSPQNPTHKLVTQTAEITTASQRATISSATNQKNILETALMAAQQNFLLGEIQHRLSQYLSYPIRAQRRGWQGEVLVGFHVDKQGFLHNIHLTQTSGYSLLDNATLSAFGKVKYIPLSSWFKNNRDEKFHPTALQLPVKYQLTNS
jgi:TonB family protein